MGAIISTLRSLRLALAILLQQIFVDDVSTRLLVSPGLPLPNPTTSFWLLPESRTLKRIQSPSLPARADIVVIGCGITATALLRELYRQNPALNIVVLEARGVCTGATGRNGGHIFEGPHNEYPRLKSTFGGDAAARIIHFRLRHLEEIRAAIHEEGAECLARSEVREVAGTEVYFDDSTIEEGVGKLRQWKADLPEMAREWDHVDAETAKKELHIPDAAGAISGPCGALWPYRMCTSILERLVREQPDRLKIESYTPVESISYDPSTSTYSIATPRGVVTTPTVVHTTNGWASHLIPGFRGKVFPMQGQMCEFALLYLSLHNSTRPTTSTVNPDGTATISNGEMMFGGAWAQTGNNGMDVVGSADDTKLNYLAAGHLSGLLPYVFGSGVTKGATRAWEGAAVKNMWTGVLGMSADCMPWVGKLPTAISARGQPKNGSVELQGEGEGSVKTGEWCAVGFTGEGMVNCWGSATALARMLLGEDQGGRNVAMTEQRVRAAKGEAEVKSWSERPLEEWFPAQFLVSQARVKKADPVDMFDSMGR
ncbi:hypothetical protein DRE_01001 [Drechslerella stenobrocha 248]|uniref:FAD dependent oxidoreductase domain-containing protein n=1 Tax=Drechslerella stenobrocha 248 TaxID=1043628 RepID=W7HXR2_9PEZI|nr:hypothetical protein DRE_01001 [Drechslerella stenobrocha 248]